MLCHRPGRVGQFHKGRSINISTSGILFEAADHDFKHEDIINLELSIPPDINMLDYGGRLKSLAKVIRVIPAAPKPLVAAQFFSPPRFII